MADPGLAVSVLHLHLNSHKWIHHRLHQVTFLDETTVREAFTLDLTIPAHAPELWARGMRIARLLPIDLLQKQNLVNFDIHDHRRQLLPYCTRSQLGVITTVMLVEFAKSLLDKPLPNDLVRYLGALVTSDAKAIKENERKWRRAVVYGSEELRILDTKVEFDFILQRLTKNLLLLVPTEAEPGARLKICYSLDLPLERYLQDPRGIWKRLCEQLGWRATSIDFPLTAAAETQSYNFEVEDPPGIDLYQAAIVEHRAPREGRPPDHILHDWRLGGVTRLNLHACGVERSSAVVAHVDIEDSSEFWLQAFIITSFVLGVLLLTGSWQLPRMLEAGGQPQGTNEVAATLLLFIAGVIATLLMRSDPRGLLRRMLKRLRQLATFTAAVPIVAVGVLLYSPCGPLLRWAWLGCGLTVLLAGVLATLSYRLPKPPQEPPRY